MKFRPCIDIHNGSVKQIVGGSLSDAGNKAKNNFISQYDAEFYANMYKEDNVKGGHIIILNKEGTPYYEQDVNQAKKALAAFPGGMQIGGGINDINGKKFLEMGASHIIVTSFVFRDGIVDFQRLNTLKKKYGKDKIVLDLSCRFVGDDYYIVTDRWQNVTKEKMNLITLNKLEKYCDEFLVHAVDVEGKASGIETKIIEVLGSYCDRAVTYAGGIHSIEDLEIIRTKGNSHVDFTIGSALDLFGGDISYREIIKGY